MRAKGAVKYVKSLPKSFSTPIFLLFLLLASVLWYVAKLSYTYMTDIPVEVSIEDNRFRVYCRVEGTGYKLFAHRYIFNDEIRLSLDEIEYDKSVSDKNSYVIDAFSLQNAISQQKEDIRIISIGDIPEITIISQDE